MNFLNGVVLFMDFLIKYIIPLVALVMSILSLRDSREANKVQERLIQVEEKLKKYELEEKEKDRIEATKACVEASIIKISKGWIEGDLDRESKWQIAQ